MDQSRITGMGTDGRNRGGVGIDPQNALDRLIALRQNTAATAQQHVTWQAYEECLRAVIEERTRLVAEVARLKNELKKAADADTQPKRQSRNEKSSGQ